MGAFAYNSGENNFSIIMMGAVGGEALKSSLPHEKLEKITLPAKRPLDDIDPSNVRQVSVRSRGLEYLKRDSFKSLISGKN